MKPISQGGRIRAAPYSRARGHDFLNPRHPSRKQLDADFFQIDAGFVRGLGHCELSRRIVFGLPELAVGLGMTTIAESVEERSIVADLVGAGIDFAQGFALGPVAALQELEPGGSA